MLLLSTLMFAWASSLRIAALAAYKPLPVLQLVCAMLGPAFCVVPGACAAILHCSGWCSFLSCQLRAQQPPCQAATVALNMLCVVCHRFILPALAFNLYYHSSPERRAASYIKTG